MIYCGISFSSSSSTNENVPLCTRSRWCNVWSDTSEESPNIILSMMINYYMCVLPQNVSTYIANSFFHSLPGWPLSNTTWWERSSSWGAVIRSSVGGIHQWIHARTASWGFFILFVRQHWLLRALKYPLWECHEWDIMCTWHHWSWIKYIICSWGSWEHTTDTGARK